MPRRPLLVAAALVAAAGAALTGCSGHDAVSQGGTGNGYQVGDAALRWFPVHARHAVDGVAGTTLTGQHLDLAAWRGHVVVVNFWGQWCAPCQAEADALQQVYADDRASGVEFLGVDIRDNRASALAFTRAHHVTYPSLFDPANSVALHFRDAPPNATPTTLVLDRMGRVAARQSGEILYTQLRDVVARVAAERAA